MLLKSLFLTLTILSLSACKSSAPKSPVIKECRLIKADVLEQSYLYCLKSDGSPFEQRIPLVQIPTEPQNASEAFICTSFSDYLSLKKFEKDLTAWIKRSCK